MANVVIAGPNLRDQSKGSFHVHAPGCRDLTKVAKKEPAYRDAWVEDVASRQEIVELIYEDQMDEWERDHPGDRLDWREYDDIYMFPCCDALDLPDQTPNGDEDDEDDDEDTPLEHASSMATKHGESDGDHTAEEALTTASILGYLEENVGELMEQGSDDELDAIATAYVESFIDAFTMKCRQTLAEFLEPEEDDE